MTRLGKGFQYLMDGSLRGRLIAAWLERKHMQELKIKQKKERARELLWDTFSERPEVLFELQPGVRLILFTDDYLSKLIWSTDYEWTERKFLNFLLKPGDVFIDIGSNIGLYSVIAAKLVGENGRVLSLEPAGKAYERLVKNMQINNYKNVTCMKLAVSDKNNERKMMMSVDGFSAWNSLAETGMRGAYQSETIQSVLLDDVIEKAKIKQPITMVKIDVEGWETHVLAGGRNLLIQHNAPILQVEFNEDAMGSANSSCFELYKALEDYGYSLFTYGGKKNKLEKAPFHYDRRYYWENLIAIKPASDISRRLKLG